MSNYTDGKKALSVGDFSKAEAKLLKALDNRPDDGELWWALMLCKSGFRNDDELVASLKAEFTSAARDGGAAPTLPFDSTYCKNALRFEKSGKRRAFITSLTAELSEIWAQERGTPLKVKPVKNVKSARSSGGKLDKYRLLTYLAVGICAVFGALAVYGVFALLRWALWCGFIVFLLFAVTTLVLKKLTERAGGSARLALVLVIVIFCAVCVGLFIAGMTRGDRSIMIMSAAVFAMVVMASLFRLSYNKFATRSAKGGKSSQDNTRDPIKLAESMDRTKSGNPQKNKSRTVDNEYKDDYD